MEDCYAMPSPDCAVTEERFCSAFRSLFISWLLDRLGFPLIGARESYRMLLELIREVKAMRDRTRRRAQITGA
eukprot:IDg19124t1